jgi:carboxymethylenebutenolidase
MGEMISFRGNGDSYAGYLAKPPKGTGPGVIVIQEYWGLVGHIKEVAERFAAAGFVALAPDFYSGVATEEPEEAGKLMMALNIDEAEKTLRGAIDELLTRCEGKKVGVVGFCMGGQLALFAAASNPEKVGACVDFYGIHPNVQPAFTNLDAPVLGFFAEHDDYAPAEAVNRLDNTLSELGKEHEFVTFPGTHHAFFNTDRPEVHDAEASEKAWVHMVAFFRNHL